MSLAAELRERFVWDFPAEAAREVETQDEPTVLLPSLSSGAVGRLLNAADPGRLLALFLTLDDEQQGEVLPQVNLRTAMLLLRELPEDERTVLLDRLPRLLQQEYADLLDFPENSAVRFMDRLTNRYSPEQTVDKALEVLRQSNFQRLRSLYLADDSGGLADLQDMALADQGTLMADLLHTGIEVARLDSTEEDLVMAFERSRVDSIPVVDEDNKLIGVIRYAELMQAAEEAATADIQRMVGASADERALSTPLFAVKRRLVWLHINLLTAFMAAAVVGLFESTIASFTALAILLPVVAGQSGNAGSQALAVTMRGLALKEIGTAHWPAVLSKEVQIGMINGAVLALTCGLGVWVWSQSWGLALVIAIAMISAMVMAGASGALVPVVLSRLGQDPATASSIILTTVTDITGFLVFLGTATLLSGLL